MFSMSQHDWSAVQNRYDACDSFKGSRVTAGTKCFRFHTTHRPSHHRSPGQMSLFTLLIIDMQKDVGHWPLLPWATAVKQKRRKERKLIPAIWGRKGEEEGRGHGRRHALNWHEAEKYQGRSMDRGVQVQRQTQPRLYHTPGYGTH